MNQQIIEILRDSNLKELEQIKQEVQRFIFLYGSMRFGGENETENRRCT